MDVSIIGRATSPSRYVSIEKTIYRYIIAKKMYRAIPAFSDDSCLFMTFTPMIHGTKSIRNKAMGAALTATSGLSQKYWIPITDMMRQLIK